ncbi:DUF6702 family protein [Erythrobacter sp. R86502]|uniref:DUF6702 family protein n=1 Tax=Erythrobacter sp. R86502 TaxID=3093846 RepID=UPI0036D2A377
MSWRGLLVLAALALTPLGAGSAAAHQQKIAITTVALNPRTHTIEIAHQVPLHDAEHALRFQGADNADIIASADSREAFARYVTRRFLLTIDGAIVTPDYVGSEITGGNLWVYQETPVSDGATPTLRVNSQILTDIWARQENRVNIGSGTQPATFVFRSGDVPQSAVLTR